MTCYITIDVFKGRRPPHSQLINHVRRFFLLSLSGYLLHRFLKQIEPLQHTSTSSGTLVAR
jgi:hypothetical protein